MKARDLLFGYHQPYTPIPIASSIIANPHELLECLQARLVEQNQSLQREISRRKQSQAILGE
eukprot:2857779-Pleurochrysis_carterae.AAC.1